MIVVSDKITLQKIRLEDQKELYTLMARIYPPPYEHLWLDKGKWYVEELYSFKNLKEDLNDTNSRYYFIHYKRKTVGIIKILLDSPFVDSKTEKATKLQRIYLDEKMQGKGIGKILINWTLEMIQPMDKTLLWLEAMDTQTAALRFYEKMGFQISSEFRFVSDLMLPELKGMYRMWKTV